MKEYQMIRPCSRPSVSSSFLSFSRTAERGAQPQALERVCLFLCMPDPALQRAPQEPDASCRPCRDNCSSATAAAANCAKDEFFFAGMSGDIPVHLWILINMSVTVCADELALKLVDETLHAGFDHHVGMVRHCSRLALLYMLCLTSPLKACSSVGFSQRVLASRRRFLGEP